MYRNTIKTSAYSRRSGMSLVEIVLALPVFLVVVCGVVEFARALMVGQLVTNAARIGVEQAAQKESAVEEVGVLVRQYLEETAGVPAERVCVYVEDVRMPPGVPRLALKDRPTHSCAVTVAVNYDDVAFVAGRFLAGTQLTGTCSLPVQ